MYENRIKHLEEMHHALDKKIHGKESTGVFTDDEIHKMKQHKLLLKDQIAALKEKQKHNDF